MAESEVKKDQPSRRKRKRTLTKKERRRRVGLLAAIAAGIGFGTFIGALAGYLLVPRSRARPIQEPGQMLSAWKEVARKLSEQLETDGAS